MKLSVRMQTYIRQNVNKRSPTPTLQVQSIYITLWKIFHNQNQTLVYDVSYFTSTYNLYSKRKIQQEMIARVCKK